MWPFNCRHPVGSLGVEKEHSVTASDVDDRFEIVTYHLYCQKCFKCVQVTHARPKDTGKYFGRR